MIEETSPILCRLGDTLEACSNGLNSFPHLLTRKGKSRLAKTVISALEAPLSETRLKRLINQLDCNGRRLSATDAKAGDSALSAGLL